ncbi:hypothetical protein [Nonomuraea cavernae]
MDFDGVQVEICHWKLDELSISWNSIDVGEHHPNFVRHRMGCCSTTGRR